MANWFITGVSSGIGEALARAALARGDAVMGTVRSDAAATAFEGIAPGRSWAIQVDMADAYAIPSAALRAISTLGRVDFVVNNAGQNLFGAVEETMLDEARALFDVNLFAPLAVIKAFLPHFRERGAGWFVSMSSGCGISGTPGLGLYSATKFALEGLSEALAKEVAGFGIRMLIVEPGAVRSRFISDGTADVVNRLDAYQSLSGRGKSGLEAYYAAVATLPEDVAAAILAALDRDDPPLRLIVGDDLKASTRERLRSLLAAADA